MLCRSENKKGELYTKKSFISIRYGLQKHFDKELGVDIVNFSEFKAANALFDAMMAKMKREGKAEVVHKEPLSKADLEMLYNSFDIDTLSGRQNKVLVYRLVKLTSSTVHEGFPCHQ